MYYGITYKISKHAFFFSNSEHNVLSQINIVLTLYSVKSYKINYTACQNDTKSA